MARPPKPVELKRLEGYAGHHPVPSPTLVGGRIAPDDVLPLPADLSAAQEAAWHELSAPLVAAGMLDRADLPGVDAEIVRMPRRPDADPIGDP